MEIEALTLARLLLAAVFAVAGVAKLADIRGSQAAVRGFGLPGSLAVTLGVALPLAELAIAGALFPAATARYAALAALALLVAFVAAIAWALVRGRTPECHCFGQLHSAPVGWTTLSRNAAFAALAALVLSQPVVNPTAVELAVIAVSVVIAGQAVLSYKLLRRYGRALQRIEELEAQTPEPKALEVGAPAPAFVLPALGGGEISLDNLLARSRPALLVFADPGCGPCHALLPDLTRWQHELREQLTVALVSRGHQHENAVLAEEHGLETVLLQDDREVAELYGAYGTPSAVLVGADGRIAYGLVAGAGVIEELVSSVVPTVTIPEPASNGLAKVAAAAALAGGLAATGTSAKASLGSASQQPSDPELRAILAILRKRGPRVVKAAERAQRAVRAQATLDKDAAQRRKRAAAVRAVASQRKEVLALRAELARLKPDGATAYSVRELSLQGLALFAQSLRMQERALVATPKAAARLLDDSQETLLRSLPPFASAAQYMRRR